MSFIEERNSRTVLVLWNKNTNWQYIYMFCNYKHFSILLLSLVEANCCFVAVDDRAAGKSSDSDVCKELKHMGRKLGSNQLGISGSRPSPNDEKRKCMSFVIAGDETFGLAEHVLRPNPKRNLSVQQRIYRYSYRSTAARRMVECAFRIMANKWRIVHRPLDVILHIFMCC